MYDYLLTIRISFECVDDVDARKEAQKIIDGSIVASKEETFKLQRLNPGKPPDNVKLRRI